MNIIRKLAERQANKDARPLPRPYSLREKSANEAKLEYKPVGYHVHFCFHDKSYYEVCSACRRTRSDAQRNLLSL